MFKTNNYIIWYCTQLIKEVAAKYSVGFVIMLFGLVLLAGLLFLFVIVGYWNVFKKAGEPGYKVLIPIYNLFILSRISGGSAARFFLLLIPGVNIVVYLKVCLDLAEDFSKSKGFAIGLWLAPFVFSLLLGFGTAESRSAPEKDDDDMHWVAM